MDNQLIKKKTSERGSECVPESVYRFNKCLRAKCIVRYYYKTGIKLSQGEADLFLRSLTSVGKALLREVG